VNSSENLGGVCVSHVCLDLSGRGPREGDSLGEDWSNDLARPAPDSEGVKDDDVMLLEGGVELGFAAGTRHVSNALHSANTTLYGAKPRGSLPGDVVDNHVCGGVCEGSSADVRVSRCSGS
jgi:hypothetical protein